LFKSVVNKTVLFIIILFTLVLCSFSVRADSSFKVGQTFGQSAFCFSEDAIYLFVEADSENETKASMTFRTLVQFNMCDQLTGPVTVIITSILMDYIDSAGNKIQVVTVEFNEDNKHLKTDKILYTIVYQELAKDAPYAKDHI
tara:strand:- start:382 stop:810 length:429 start_codon:yes stop_codon:yes gene_type:complete